MHVKTAVRVYVCVHACGCVHAEVVLYTSRLNMNKLAQNAYMIM